MGGEDEDVRARHDALSVAAKTGQQEPVPQAKLVSGPTNLLLEGTVADGDEAHGEPVVDEPACRLEEHLVSLLLSHVGDGDDEYLVGLDPELRPHLTPGERPIVQLV